jgi:hypothetical protein
MTDLVVQPGTVVEAGMSVLPPWLASDPFSIGFMFCLFLQDDGLLDRIRLGVTQGFPNTPFTQPEALAAQGQDRRINRGRFEPSDSYAGRVQKARTTWKLAGNAQTLLQQIWAYFLPTPPRIRYVVNGVDQNLVPYADWWTIESDGTMSHLRVSPSNWDWDGQVGKVRFWVIVYRPADAIFWGALGAGPDHTGSGLDWGVPPDQDVWGFAGSNQWYTDVKATINQWKAAGSHAGVYPSCDGGIVAVLSDPDVVFSPTNPPGGVGDAAMPDGDWNNFANRNPAAVFLSGV